MLFRSVIVASLVLANFNAAAARAHRPKLAPITDMMRVHGQPDSVTVVGKHNRAYRWRLTADVSFPDDESVVHQSLTCNVTALVSPSGRILNVVAEPFNPGAAAVASVGTFGPLCEKRFGSLSRRSQGTPLRMKAR